MTNHIPVHRRRITLTLLLVLLAANLVSCGPEQTNQTLSYKETKSMLMDILKSEDGKKAIQEAMAGNSEHESETMRMLSTPQGEMIKVAVKDILTDPNYPKHLQQMMTDPKFAGEFAKAVQKENKEIHKQLLSDPEYQTELMELMDSKEFKEIVFEVMKGKDVRKQMMSVMQEAIETPVFRMEMLELMKKAMEEENKPQSIGKEDKEGGGKEGSDGEGGN